MNPEKLARYLVTEIAMEMNRNIDLEESVHKVINVITSYGNQRFKEGILEALKVIDDRMELWDMSYREPHHTKYCAGLDLIDEIRKLIKEKDSG